MKEATRNLIRMGLSARCSGISDKRLYRKHWGSPLLAKSSLSEWISYKRLWLLG